MRSAKEQRSDAEPPPTPAAEGGVIAPGVIVAGALAFVVLLAAGTAVLRPFTDGSVDHTSELIRALVGAAVAVTAVAGVGVGVGQTLRRRGTVSGATGAASKRLWSGVMTVGLTGAALALVALITVAVGATAGIATLQVTPTHGTRGPVTAVERTTTPAGPTPVKPVELDAKPVTFPAWLTTVFAILATIAAVITLIIGFRTVRIPTVRFVGRLFHGPPSSSTVESPEFIDLQAAAESFSESAALIADDSDPRRAIIAAYARLLERLDEAGCRRRPAEAPEEHLRRSLRALNVAPASLELVVAKFLVARFSRHPLTETDRDQVGDSLRAAAAELIATNAQQAAERDHMRTSSAR